MGQPRGRPLLLLLWAVLGGASGLKVLSFSLAYHDLPGGHGAFTRTLRDSGVLDGAIRAAFPAAFAK